MEPLRTTEYRGKVIELSQSERAQMSKKKRFVFNIDVLGVCNLSCPSCPTGNMRDPQRLKGLKGLMQPDLLDRILAKAVTECEVAGVGLFNWAEPFLHPRLPELIRIVHGRGIPCHLSSNLNDMKNIEAVLAENPFTLRISLSGFTQQVYGRTHRGGDIERVKRNMVELAKVKERLNSRTHIHVLYHRYKGNLEDEPLMRSFARQLGFAFVPVWAMMMPVEKILAYVNDTSYGVALTDEDHQVIDQLALPLGEALTAARRQNAKTCTLQDDQMTLDHRGIVSLCCSVYEGNYNLGSYLDLTLDELQDRKYKQNICKSCMSCGVSTYITYGFPELDNIAAGNIDPKHAKLLGLRYERLRKRLREVVQPALDLLRRVAP